MTRARRSGGSRIVRRSAEHFSMGRGLAPVTTSSSTLETGDRREKTKGIMISHASDSELSSGFTTLVVCRRFAIIRGKEHHPKRSFALGQIFEIFLSVLFALRFTMPVRMVLFQKRMGAK